MGLYLRSMRPEDLSAHFLRHCHKVGERRDAKVLVLVQRGCEEDLEDEGKSLKLPGGHRAA